MALNDISLTAGMRSNLISLQNTTTLLDRTQVRLSTGKKVNTALDNPTNFFAAQGHSQRASDLTVRKDGMAEAVQAVQAANKGITSITSLIESAKGLTQAALSADAGNRNALAAQFNVVLEQISTMASDSGYKGKNFLTGAALNVLFNENGSSMLGLSGFDATASGLGLVAVSVGSTAATTGTTALTGYQLVNYAVKTATLSTVLPAGTIAASTFTQVASGNWMALVSGVQNMLAGTASYSGALTVDISGVVGLMGGSTFSGVSMFTGAITVNAVIVEGVRFGSDGSVQGLTGSIYSGAAAATFTKAISSGIVAYFAGQISGAGPNPLSATGTLITAIQTGVSGSLNFTGAIFNTITGNVQANGQYSGINFNSTTSIRFELTNASINATGERATASNLIYDLAGSDIASGVTILSGYVTGTNGADGKTKLTGLVMVDNSWVDASNYTVSGSKIYFKTGAAPTLGNVTYVYNSGFTAGSTTGVKSNGTVFTGQTLTTGQEITAVTVAGTTLTTGFSVSGNIITLSTGVSSGAVGYTVTTTVDGGWLTDDDIDSTVNALTTAIETLRTQSASLASNLSVVTIRQDFTDQMVTTLLKGADNLTLADMNEEGANMLMLQTRQQLGTTSLSMASQAAQSVLRLF